jgi:aryl-phospho-beta-D-glucosidase BglC (GH1 family)
MFDKYSLWSDATQLHGANFNLRMRVRGLDPDSSNPFFPDYNSDSFVQLRSAGANVIFLSIPISFMVEPPYKIEADHFSFLDDLVNRAEAAGLLVVLAFRTSPNRPDQDILDALPVTLEPTLEQAADQPQAGFIQMWQLVADKFKGRSSIVGYDLLIEPPSQPNTAEDRDNLGLNWQDLCQRTITAIREIDADTPILVQPRAWASPETLPAWQQIGLFRSPI